MATKSAKTAKKKASAKKATPTKKKAEPVKKTAAKKKAPAKTKKVAPKKAAPKKAAPKKKAAAKKKPAPKKKEASKKKAPKKKEAAPKAKATKKKAAPKAKATKKKAAPKAKATEKKTPATAAGNGKPAAKKARPEPRKVPPRVLELVGDALSIPDEKAALRYFYAGNQIPSPNGGFFIPLGSVRAGEDGSALIFLECSASSLRYWLEVPKATRTERRKVRDVLNAGDDPDCPRHEAQERLVRVGRDLVCNLCGIAYARV